MAENQREKHQEEQQEKLLKLIKDSPEIQEVKDNELNKELKKREDFVNDINDHINKIQKQNLNLKRWFFIIVMAMYIFVIVGSVSGIIVAICLSNGWVEIVSVTGTALASMLVSILKIPSIIADYLYPKEREIKDLAKIRMEERAFEEQNKKDKRIN